jgi:hypothetical protein
MCFRVIEQLAGTDKARGGEHNQGNSENDEGKPVVTTNRPGQPFELQSTFRIKQVLICYREQKHVEFQQKHVEFLNDEPERYHGDASAHPSEKRSLVGSMITVAADHETPLRSSETRRLLATPKSGSFEIPRRPHGIVQIGDTLIEGVATRGDAHIGTGEVGVRPSISIGALDGIGALGATPREQGGNGGN